MLNKIPSRSAVGSRRPHAAAQPQLLKSTVYFDGSCTLCSAEIGYYRRQDGDDAICFVDVSDTSVTTPEGLTRQRAMERFHVLRGDGRMVSGAAAFIEVWSRLPNWRWAARIARFPGVSAVLELSYRLFLPIRPVISRVVRRLLQPGSVNHGARRG